MARACVYSIMVNCSDVLLIIVLYSFVFFNSMLSNVEFSIYLQGMNGSQSWYFDPHPSVLCSNDRPNCKAHTGLGSSLQQCIDAGSKAVFRGNSIVVASGYRALDQGSKLS